MTPLVVGDGKAAWREPIGSSDRNAVVVLDLATMRSSRFDPPAEFTAGRLIAIDARELVVQVVTPGRRGTAGRRSETWRGQRSSLCEPVAVSVVDLTPRLMIRHFSSQSR
jgi:hypothetical protein